MTTESIIMFLGGIALFIFGITLMSDYLKKASGNRFKTIIDKAVNTPLKGILVGTLITAITNSSTGVVVLVIGMVRAGLMTSAQSVGIIMGANIGTTFSAFIISLPIGKYAYAILFVGVICLFLKNKKSVNIGGILTGIGMLFLGLNVMGDGMEKLISLHPAATDSLFQTFSKTSFGGTMSGFLFGTVFTAIIQSSSAATAIIQKLYSLNDPANGIVTLSLRGVLPIILGANLGTTLTGMIAAVGGNDESKRTAWIHVVFNLLGVVVFMIGIHPYYLVTQMIENKFLSPYSMATIAYAHLIQNIVSTVLLMFFIKQIVQLTEWIVPPKNDKKIELVFDEKLIEQSPGVALDFIQKAIFQLSTLVYEYFESTRNYSFTKNNKHLEEADTYEMIIDELDAKIHNYLIKIIRQGDMSHESEDLSKYLDITKDLERIGDHLTNITEFFSIRYDSNHELSIEGKKDMLNLYNLVDKMFISVKTSIESGYTYLPKDVLEIEKEVDILEENARLNYLQRLKVGEFDFAQTSNFTDILSDIERIGDHLNNIASSIIDPMQEDVKYTGLKKREV
ncbi:Na/Pi cotransporter family protein [Haploplasma axanthum]|uniref:Na/Pi-cotransporter II-related protein n=1 Tax=Haploplasma axanthum TaxID=29552 RepID=A0A449BDM7_HAPAX|nr:Na/Pi cotransporter family protein [Haploplasma axanthum]VEU80549.1 Na/Pi-cotransporter II-related protein [Haploplasma axanthum]